MDGSMHSESPSTSRRRPRESETESQKIKREKAAERQRRKRERDRNNAGMGIMAFSTNEHNHQHYAAALQHQQQQQAAAVAAQQAAQQQAQQQQLQQQQAQQAQQQQQQQQQQAQQQQQPQQPQEYGAPQELTPEEIARRDRVRAAARERQRKHRLLVKQRRMRELGIDMGNDVMPGMEEAHYRAAADGQYHQVLPPELQQQLPPHPPIPHHEPPFPQGAPLGGQTFASTLLLSFSCAPLLKQHLLRTLAMSNEELASLEPIIAEAWDRWDHQRRMHYAEAVAKNGGQPPMAPPFPVEMTQHDPQAPPPPGPPPHPFPHPNGPGPTDPSQAGNDFRARFHRSMIVPTPFRAPAFTETQPPASAATPSSTSGSAPAEAIDPHLASAANGNATSNATTSTTSASKSETDSSSIFDGLLTPGSP